MTVETIAILNVGWDLFRQENRIRCSIQRSVWEFNGKVPPLHMRFAQCKPSPLPVGERGYNCEGRLAPFIGVLFADDCHGLAMRQLLAKTVWRGID